MGEKKKHLISNPAYRISSYVPFTRNSLQTLLSYRTNVLFYFLGNILRIFVFYFLWKAIFASSGEEVLRGFTLPQMLIYLILTTSVSELSGSVGSDMSDEIGTGQIAMSLIKPISFRLRIYFTSLGDTLYCFIMSGLPGVAAVYILSFVYGIHQELTLLNLLLFFVSLSFSLIIRMSYNFMFSLLGFVTTNMFGLWQVNKAIVQLTSGAVIPLLFFSRGGKKSFCRSSVCFADFNSAEHLSWKIQRGRNLTSICTSGSVDCHNYNRRKYYMEESCKASCYSGRMIWA